MSLICFRVHSIESNLSYTDLLEFNLRGYYSVAPIAAPPSPEGKYHWPQNIIHIPSIGLRLCRKHKPTNQSDLISYMMAAQTMMPRCRGVPQRRLDWAQWRTQGGYHRGPPKALDFYSD
ncbi:hypothetical protein TNCV_3241351 [Trichonephila clavipes]|nr:hypothetical protein TNCV_3241351 [Trichonephila clavipes]